MRYNLLALDLDGTLTDDNKRITPRTKDALLKAMEKGVEIILASGRPDIGIAPVANELGLYGKGGYILAFNGGRIIDCKSGKILSETAFPREYYSEIISLRDRFDGVEVLTYTSEGIISGSVTKYVTEECRCNACPVEAKENLLETVRGLSENEVKFLVVGEHEKLIPVRDYLTDNFSNKFGAYFSQPFFLEVVPFGIDKANSLKKLLSILGKESSSLMACGDGENDIPMLKVAGLPVAMENASDIVKKHAAFVTKSNNDDGVAIAVEKFILGER